VSGDFRTALQVYNEGMNKLRLTTSSGDLDLLIGGGIEPGRFYLFYGEGDSGVDFLIHRILINSLLDRGKGGLGGRCLYVNCGNYKRERTILDIELLAGMAKAANLDPLQAMSDIYAVCAFSEDQEERVVDEVCRLIERDREIRLVVVHHIAKLFTSPTLRTAIPSIARLQKVVGTIFQACARNGTAFVTNCRPKAALGGRIPSPEGGRYLRHTASVIVYLRRAERRQFVHAFLLKHYDRPQRRTEFILGDESVGRITIPFRTRLQEQLDELKKNLAPVLMDRIRADAFESLSRAWTSEQGAMSYLNVPTVLDAMVLVGEIDNRKLILELTERLVRIEGKIDRLQKG